MAVARPAQVRLLESADEQAELPDELPASEAQLVEGSDADEVRRRLLREVGALDEIEERSVRTATAALILDPHRTSLAHATYIAEANAHRAAQVCARVLRVDLLHGAARVAPGAAASSTPRRGSRRA